ncbi:hypothetical protein ACT1UH_03080 [Mycoplasma sp. 332]|uniref:hypothetical protein n=1 Tax=Mycoplasma sp. 332 TaxID=3458236 RepID=UPI004036F662
MKKSSKILLTIASLSISTVAACSVISCSNLNPIQSEVDINKKLKEDETKKPKINKIKELKEKELEESKKWNI